MKMKLNQWMKLSVLTAIVGLTGCNESTINCNSDGAKVLALQVVNQHVGWAMYEQLENVRTQSQNAERGVYLCAAEATGKAGSVTVIYSVQLTDDKKSFVVTLLNG
ncbi:hypothetical protein [Providencia stuartii]|uniref:hypothetical protein n=1 Tax=Providencia stuartii TaxID=588 RepID=UPI001BCDFF19|nr:hypothetical protein [Providencia thailandensis]MBS7785266.1 hypothetical protein [Providencia thailandensis]